MAQFGRALRSGRRGRWFKSSQPDQSMRRDRFLRSLFLASVVIPRYPRYTHSSLSRCIVEVYMFGLRAPELIIILVVVLIIFGPKNLPKLGKSLGSTVKNIREGMEGDDKAETKQAEEVVVEQSEEDKEIAELEAKLAAAKKKQAEDSDADAE